MASETSFDESNYKAWNDFFEKYINEDGLVDYQGLSQDQETFKAIVNFFSKTKLNGASKEQQLAFYMNAYNVLCMEFTLAKIKSDAHFKGYLSWWSKFKVFFWAGISVAGKSSTLYKLENDIIRAQFQEPRIHMCINCASFSCPRLKPRMLFNGTDLEEEMNERTKSFIQKQAGVKIDQNTITISEIFKWYKDDFEKSGGVVKLIAAYEPSLPENPKIKYQPYNWALNTQH